MATVEDQFTDEELKLSESEIERRMARLEWLKQEKAKERQKKLKAEARDRIMAQISVIHAAQKSIDEMLSELGEDPIRWPKIAGPRGRGVRPQVDEAE